MNVLVYSGPGTTGESIKHCLEALRFHLLPYYAVVTVSEAALLNDPWQLKTKALVFPGGADLPYCNSFNGQGNRLIHDFVRKGGKFIGFCAGGYYASKRIEFEANSPMEVSGPRELGFFPGICRGSAYKGFKYNSHQGARITRVESTVEGPQYVANYHNGGGVFVDADSYRGVEVLGRYTEPLDVDGNGNAAVILCQVGKGSALLTGTHPEFMAQNQPVLQELMDHENDRKVFLKGCLTKLGLKVNQDFNVPSITPIHLATTDSTLMFKAINDLRENVEFIGSSFEDVNDTFHLHDLNEVIDDPEQGTHLVVHKDIPSSGLTPYFDMNKYFSYLDQLYKHNNVDGKFGKLVGYGEVVSSTSTLLDKNPRWLPHLPHGFMLNATTQVAGRGRGGNVWINPKGVMAQSVLFRVEPQNSKSIVTLQYVLGLAVVELIFGYGSLDPTNGVGYEDLPIKLKWPNDIYIMKPEFFNLTDNVNPSTVDGTEEKYAKMAGAIVNSQYLDRKFNLVWGCGINVSNEAPTTSLNLVLDQLNVLRQQKGLLPLPPFEHELLTAKLLFTVNQYYSVFEHSGMKPFLPLYYKRWFHSDQLVTVTSDGQTRTCKIQGITEDSGLLVVYDINTGEKLELQPDGNSFDIFKGLVYRKVV